MKHYSNQVKKELAKSLTKRLSTEKRFGTWPKFDKGIIENTAMFIGQLRY